MQYEEFLTLTGETQQTVSLDFYKAEIEPRYMMFDGLKKPFAAYMPQQRRSTKLTSSGKE